MTKQIFALVALALLVSGCANVGPGADTERKDCGVSQLPNIGQISGLESPPDLSKDAALVCWEKSIEACSPSTIKTISHDETMESILEIVGKDGGNCVIRSSYRDVEESEDFETIKCSVDLGGVFAKISEAEAFNQEGGKALAAITTMSLYHISPRLGQCDVE